MTTIYLGIGTNLGDKPANIRTCLQQLETQVGPLLYCSSFYYSQPQGFTSDNDFINVVVQMQTTLSPLDLLHTTQTIERQMGRTQKSQRQTANGEQRITHFDRIIDIDILYYGNLQQVFTDAAGEEILTIPHPCIADRDFVTIPLRELHLQKN